MPRMRRSSNCRPCRYAMRRGCTVAPGIDDTDGVLLRHCTGAGVPVMKTRADHRCNPVLCAPVCRYCRGRRDAPCRVDREDGRILLDADIVQSQRHGVEALENGIAADIQTHVQLRRASAWVWESTSWAPSAHRAALPPAVGHVRDCATWSAMSACPSPPETPRAPWQYRCDADHRTQTAGPRRLPGAHRRRSDIEALLPMRPMAYIKRDWSITSEPWSGGCAREQTAFLMWLRPPCWWWCCCWHRCT